MSEDTDEEPAETGDEPVEEDDESPGIQASDVIRLAYTAYSQESEQLVDTTDPEIAEEEGVDQEERTFEPRVIVVGEGHLFDPVEDAIEGLEPGESGTVTVPADEAFGEEDPEQVRTVSVDKIPEDDRYPGAHVDIDGEHGFVETIIGGRARVDFNHPLAGEAIEYEFEIIEQLEDRHELAQGLLRTYLDLDLDVWFQSDEVAVEPTDAEDEVDAEEADVEGDDTETVESLYIEATPQLSMNQQWLFGKQQIASDLIDQVGVDRVVVQEILESRDRVIEETQALLEEDIDEFDAVEELVDTEE